MKRKGFSSGAASVVVVGVNRHGMGLIRECLGTEAVLPTNSTPYAEAAQIVHKVRPNVVVVGFDEDFDEAVRLGAELGQQNPGVHLVAMSERTDPERIRAGMRAGYREYVVLPEDGNLLRQAVHESAYAPESDENSGQVVTFVGSKGGVGVTFLVSQLAAEMSALERVCVIDMDFNMGDVASFLDLTPKSNISDLLRNIGRLDERVLAGTVAIHPSKIHVLAQPNELMDLDEVRGDDVLKVLTVTAETYQHVLIDAGGGVNEATLTALTVADMVIVVCTPDVPSVKNAWRRLQLIERVGVDKEVVRLVVNRWNRQGGLSIADIERNLGLKVAATIADDPQSVQKAVNIGQLLREVDRKSASYKDINAAVALITEGASAVQSEAPAKKFWGLFG